MPPLLPSLAHLSRGSNLHPEAQASCITPDFSISLTPDPWSTSPSTLSGSHRVPPWPHRSSALVHSWHSNQSGLSRTRLLTFQTPGSLPPSPLRVPTPLAFCLFLKHIHPSHIRPLPPPPGRPLLPRNRHGSHSLLLLLLAVN